MQPRRRNRDRSSFPWHASSRYSSHAARPGLRRGPRLRGHHHRNRPGRGCTLFGVDDLGLDRLDRDILSTHSVDASGGRPVGLTTLAVSVSEDPETIEDVIEPYLMQAGLLQRTLQGPGCDRGCLSHTSGMDRGRHFVTRCPQPNRQGAATRSRSLPDHVVRKAPFSGTSAPPLSYLRLRGASRRNWADRSVNDGFRQLRY